MGSRKTAALTGKKALFWEQARGSHGLVQDSAPKEHALRSLSGDSDWDWGAKDFCLPFLETEGRALVEGLQGVAAGELWEAGADAFS